MKSNRRSVLIGLGALTVGGGAVFGTGAFSSVEADRTVEVTTAGDASALVGLDILSDDLDAQDGDVIVFDTEADLNVDGITTFTDAFEVTNNRSDGDGAINIDIKDGGTSLLTTNAAGEGSGMYFEVDTDGQLDGIEDNGQSQTVDVVFNLEGEETTNDADNAIPGEITVEANSA